MQFNALMQRGIQFLQNQNYEAAVSTLAEANQALPRQAVAVHFLGLALCQSGRFDEGAAYVQESLELAPENIKFVNNYANLLFEHGKQEEAIATYRRALECDPNYAVAWKNLGILFLAQGRLDEAEAAARKALSLKADEAAPYNVLGAVLWARKNSAAARPCFEKALAFDSGPAEYHHNLALVLSDLGLLQEAVLCYQEAIKRKPDDPAFYDNLGLALCQLERSDEGVSCFQKALELDADFSSTHSNLGVYYTSIGHYEEARSHYQRALVKRESYPQARYNLGILELTCGDFQLGWELYESRLDCAELHLQRNAAGVRWAGQPLLGKKIFVFAEQGLGDTLQFARYVPCLVEMGASVVFECQPPLLPLLKPCFETSPGIMVIARGSPEPINGDYYASLLSLPYLLETDVSSIPAVPPYLLSTAKARSHWEELFAPINSPRIGVCWAGSATHKNDRNRSIALAQFANVAQGVDARFVSLYKASGELQSSINLAEKWPALIDFTDRFRDFLETAACIAQLDLVVTVDTSVAHVAAATGKPVWLLLPYVPDWRWLLDRQDCPWYPSMRLFRQPHPGAWEEVLAGVNVALRERFPLVPA